MSTSIVIPPPCDVYGIILDILPIIAGVDSETTNVAVGIAIQLISLCEIAKQSLAVEQIFAKFMQGILRRKSISLDDFSYQLIDKRIKHRG